ncbi:MAG: acyl carrier protein [Bacteroidetes bacterium]|nr:acyl carrier protein [Bacteroidota bacterium]
MELDQKIISIIRENIEWKGEIGLNDHLINDLHTDSFDMLMIISALEDEFSIQIEEDEIRKIHYVSDIVTRLQSLFHI